MVEQHNYNGLLIVGDPHVKGRVPGLRKDDYPQVILDKLAWSINYAIHNHLLPVILGDIFDTARDNPNWLLVHLIEIFKDIEVIGLYGNHDCADPQLNDRDSLMVLIKAECFRLVSEKSLWQGKMNDKLVIIGGSSYRQQIPEDFSLPDTVEKSSAYVIWLTHHDLIVPGYEDIGKIHTREIGNIDLVINGHIHRRLEDVQKGKTLWITPGNISRRSRSEAVSEHIPAALRIDISKSGAELHYIEIPHEPFETVFHEAIVTEGVDTSESAFISGLAELEARRTESGAGIIEFIKSNIEQFEEPVALEITKLAKEVTENVE